MGKDIHEWIQRVDAARPLMVELAMRLQRPTIVVELNLRLIRICNTIPFVATVRHENNVETNIFFQLMDHQTDSDVVITNMTTLPEHARRNGCGSNALQALLSWAQEEGLHEIRATQVGDPNSQKFWEKNGFVRCAAPNPCGDYIYQCEIADTTN